MQQYIIKQIRISVIVYIGFIVLGYGYSWTAPIIPKLQDIEQTPLPDVITDGQSSWVGSLFFIGAIIGPPVASFVANKYGRKMCLFVAAATLIVAYIILATAVNLGMIYAGRFITGIGNSILTVASVIYIGEIASSNIRGALITGTVLSTSSGTLVVFAIAPFVSYQAVFYIGLAFTAVFAGLIYFSVESPIFYVIQGDEEKAKESMIALGRTDPDDIAKVLQSKKDKESEEQQTSGWRDMVTMKSNRKALFICLTICVLQMMSGISVVGLFLTTIFERAGSTIDPDMATIIMGGAQLVVGTSALFLIERSGRKILLMGSSLVGSVGLAVLGIYFYLDHLEYDLDGVGWLPLVCLMSYLIAYNMGLGLVPQTLIGELFSPTARSAGSSVSLGVVFILGFATTTIFGYVDATFYLFWIFSACCVLAFLFTLFFVPETKGKSLLEIQDMLNE